MTTQRLFVQFADAVHGGFADPRTASKKSVSIPVICAYTFSIGLGFILYHAVADGQYSVIMTLSALAQNLGAILLCMHVYLRGSAAGISANAIQLDIAGIVFRLCSTLWFEGYLPLDKSGDFMYQALDICSVGLMVWLLYNVLVTYRSTYQELDDTMKISPMIVGSMVLAIIFHCDMDDNPFFDTLWMAGLFTGVVAVIPQLWLIMRTGDKAEALVGHYIAALAVSRILSGLFMWEAKHDITCNQWMMKGFSHGIIAILGAHLVHLCLVADFGYYYVKCILRNGGALPMQMTRDSAWV